MTGRDFGHHEFLIIGEIHILRDRKQERIAHDYGLFSEHLALRIIAEDGAGRELELV